MPPSDLLVMSMTGHSTPHQQHILILRYQFLVLHSDVDLNIVLAFVRVKELLKVGVFSSTPLFYTYIPAHH